MVYGTATECIVNTMILKNSALSNFTKTEKQIAKPMLVRHAKWPENVFDGTMLCANIPQVTFFLFLCLTCLCMQLPLPALKEYHYTPTLK